MYRNIQSRGVFMLCFSAGFSDCELQWYLNFASTVLKTLSLTLSTSLQTVDWSSACCYNVFAPVLKAVSCQSSRGKMPIFHLCKLKAKHLLQTFHARCIMVKWCFAKVTKWLNVPAACAQGHWLPTAAKQKIVKLREGKIKVNPHTLKKCAKPQKLLAFQALYSTPLGYVSLRWSCSQKARRAMMFCFASSLKLSLWWTFVVLVCIAGSALFYFERGCDNRPSTAAVDWPGHMCTAAGRRGKKKTLDSPFASLEKEVRRLVVSDKGSRPCDWWPWPLTSGAGKAGGFM